MQDIFRVSVITVVFNGIDCIKNTIDSVIRQGYPNIEYIIIDGGSTDGTVDIIKSNNNRIAKWISEKDKGIYDAMNKGLRLAIGEWIIFLNSGDILNNADTISLFIANCNRFLDADIVFGDTILNYRGKEILLKQNKKNIRFESICHQSQFIRREALINYGGYNYEFPIYADYEFQLSTLLKGRERIVYLPLTIVNFNTEGVSSKPFYTFLKEYLSVVRKHVDSKQLIYYYGYALKSAVKSFIVERIIG